MKIQVKGLFFLLWTFYLTAQTTYSQNYSSKNNYTGSWVIPTSWTPTWAVPQFDVTNHNIDINGYITANGSLSFSGSSKLTVKDTLVIKGDLTINNNNDLKIEDNGILIVWGNLTISEDTQIEANGYIIVTGDIIKVGDINKGQFKSNDNPVKVFIGGTIPSGLTNDNQDYKALNCIDPNTIPYPNSTCSSGNMNDLQNDAIYPFFQSTCSITTPTITAGGPTTFCEGGSVTLTSSSGSTYLWSTGATTTSINVTSSGSYSVRVTNMTGCQSAASVATIVTVNALPATPFITAGGPTTFCDGGNVTLTSSTGSTYLWSTGATTSSINTTTSGSYSVRITNSNGCQSTSSAATPVTINALPAAPTITAGGPTTFCSGGSVTLTSSPGLSYLWSTGATTSSINVTTSGNYSVRITNANGCQSAASSATIVTVNALPVTPTITADGPTTFCEGSSVNLTSSTGSAYLWSTGATTASINVTTSGNYTVRVTNSSGCQSEQSVATIVTVNALPATPAITPGGPTTFCEGSSITLTSSAGSSYLWSTGATTPSINTSTTGNYTVSITNPNGCQSLVSAPMSITVNSLPSAPIITADGPTTFCAGGSVNLTSSPGTSYLWSTGETTSTINVTASGNYNVRVTNANGCHSAASSATAVSVNSLPAAPVIGAGGPTTFCEGGSVNLTSSQGTTYLWSTGATTQSINAAASGSYTVRITNENGCQSAPSVPTVVTVNALPAMPVITSSGSTTFCEGGGVTLTSSPGSDYLWSTGAVTPGINVSTAGSYTVQVTDANGCQSAISAPTVTTMNTLPVVNAGTDVTIPNGTSTTIDATVIGDTPFTYSWSPSGQLINALIEDPTTVNLAATTIFTLTATSIATGCSNTNTVTISISGGPLSSVPTATPSTVCAGKNVQLHAIVSGGSGTYSYTWTSTPAGFTSSIANPSVNPLVSTTYNVAVFDGFNTVNSQVNVTVNALPATPTITASGPNTFCEGGSVTLTSSPGTTYLWSTGETNSSINVSSSGSYTVQVIDANGCQSSLSLSEVVTENALPLKPIITAGGPTTFCEGGSVTLTSSPETSYLWSTGETSSSINVGISGSYTVQVTNLNGCHSALSVPIVVTENALPATPIITANGPTTFCEGGNVTLTSSAGTTYLWSTGETNSGINVSTSGSYTVQVTDANGCQSSLSIPIVVTENALSATPTITASGPTTFCEGGSVTLTSSPGTSYLWSTGETNSGINVSTSGSYTVQVTDANSCQSALSLPVVVTENALPATPTIISGGPTTFCEGNSVTLTSSAGITYLWSTSETSSSINVSTTGSYSVQVTNANGCQSAASVPIMVTENALPATPVITPGGPTTFCTGSSVTLTSSPEAMYLWSTGETNPGINVSSTGSYTVQVTDINGCQSATSLPLIVTENALPAAPVITAGGPTTFCEGGSVTLSSSPGSSYLWSSGSTNSNTTVSTSGSYTVQVTDANGCQSISSIPVTVVENALPATPTIIAGGPTTFCEGGSVTLTSSPEAIYSWSTGESTPGITVITSGSYTVQVTDANGCQSGVSVPVIVTGNALPATPTITADGPTTFCEGGSVTLTSSVGTTYLWSTAETNPDIIANISGSYTVQVTNANGCLSFKSAPVIVIENAKPTTPTITASGPTTFCEGGSLTLISSAGATYLWSTGATSQAINVTSSGSYSVQITDVNSCQSDQSLSIDAVLGINPVAIAGTDQELQYKFETQMNAELDPSETGEWSLISGSGQFADIHSPTTIVTDLSVGENTFSWKVNNGNCESSSEVKIIVLDLFVPSVITPDGDGKNDYFKISNTDVKIELIIFDRWGNEEYTNLNYLNDWNGLNDKGKELPSDTYFYILKVGTGKIIKGSVFIKR
jgi:gliding motility-associated-like protein